MVHDLSQDPTGDAVLPSQEPLRRRWWIAVGGMVLLYLASITSHWYISPDSALYLMLGESLAVGDGYTLHGRPHSFVPPGFPIVLAGLKSVGLGEMVFLNGAMVLMTLGTLWFSYLALKEHWSERMALASTLVVGFGWTLFHQSVRQLSDVPFALAVAAGIWCYVRSLRGQGMWLTIGTVLLLLSVWIRVLGVAVVAGAAVGLALETRKQFVTRARVYAVGVSLMAVVMGLVWTGHLRRQLTSESVPIASYAVHLAYVQKRSVVDWVTTPVHNMYQAGPEISSLISGQPCPAWVALAVVWVPLCVGIASGIRRRQWVVLTASASYLGCILLLRTPNVRYLIPVAPFLVSYFLEGVSILWSRIPAWRGQQQKIVVVAATLLVAMNVPKDVRLLYWLHRSDFLEFRDRWPPILEAAEYLEMHRTPSDRMIAIGASPRALSYLSDVPYVPLGGAGMHVRPPEALVEQHLEYEKVTHVIVGNGALTAYQDVLREMMAAGERFEKLYDNEDYEIWRRRDRAEGADHIASRPR